MEKNACSASARLARAALFGLLWTSFANAEVATLRIESQALPVQTIAEASIEAVHQSTLAAQIPGRVIELAVDAGDPVQRQQLLLNIDPAEAEAGLVAARAGVAQAQAALTNARAEYERARNLVARQFVSQSAADLARAQFDAATAALQAAQAQLEQARVMRGHASVRSPLDGLVAERHIEAGEMAQPGRLLLTVYDPHQMRAIADLAPHRLAALGDGPLQASVELPASGRRIDAARVTVLPAADANTHTIRVRVDLPPGIDDVAPGSFARVHFHGSVPAADAKVMIPVDAVLRRGELTAVYVADASGHFRLRQIRLGRALPDSQHIEVLSGLKGDETIALDPVQAGIRAHGTAH